MNFPAIETNFQTRLKYRAKHFLSGGSNNEHQTFSSTVHLLSFPFCATFLWLYWTLFSLKINNLNSELSTWKLIELWNKYCYGPLLTTVRPKYLSRNHTSNYLLSRNKKFTDNCLVYFLIILKKLRRLKWTTVLIFETFGGLPNRVVLYWIL